MRKMVIPGIPGPLQLWTSTKTTRKMEDKDIFDLFIRKKRASSPNPKEKNPVIEYMKSEKESFFIKINEITGSTPGKNGRNKSVEFLKKESDKIQEIFNEFSKSIENYFVLNKERKCMCFLKSSKDHDILKYFALNFLKYDIFIRVNTKIKYGKSTYNCVISSRDKELLEKLKLDKKLSEKSNFQWKLAGNEIKNSTSIKIPLKKLREEVIFFTIVTSCM
ncbi:hypothetical protein KKA39_00610 [Patescibacteria group bacterium]|nr:hypothetical protein [Patescibacteria group bacterium]